MRFVDVSRGHGGKGQPRKKAVCECCDREEVISSPKGAEGHATKKIQQMGWTLIGKVMRCPNCEAKRKVEDMSQKAKENVPLRQPTRAQIREIVSLLDDVYDVKSERYLRGDTDETVAEVLGVLPGWVVAERERAFGPAGGNEDLDALVAEVAQLGNEIRSGIMNFLSSYKHVETAYSQLEKSHSVFESAHKDAKKFNEVLRKLHKMQGETSGRLDKIQKAVGRRVMAQVK